MNLEVVLLGLARTCCLCFWGLFLLPCTLSACIKHRLIMQPAGYLVTITCVFKFVSDISLLLFCFFDIATLKLLSCSTYSIFVAVELCLHLLCSEIYTFYHRYSIKNITLLIVFLLCNYVVFVSFLVFPRYLFPVLAFYFVLIYFVIKLNTSRLRSHLKSLISRLDHQGLDQYSEYTTSYLKTIRSPDIFYLYCASILFMFNYYTSDYILILIVLFEFYLFRLKCSYASKYVLSERFCENPIELSDLTGENQVQLLTVSIDRSLTMMLKNCVLIVTPGDHELYIGEAIDDYSIFI